MARQSITPNIGVNGNGPLECGVQQPVDNALTVSWADGATYIERFKGKTSEFRGISSDGGEAYNTKFKVGKARPSLGSPNWNILINPPAPLDGMVWVIDSLSVSEIGEHSILEITYKAANEEWSGGYGDGAWNTSASAETSVEVILEDSGWTLRWASYSRNPIEYCTDIKPNDPYYGTPQADTKIADPDKVIRCSQFPKPRKWQVAASEHASDIDDIQYMWVEPNEAGDSVSADIRMLSNDREKMVLNYVNRGIQPTFHYPILTYKECWEIPFTPELSAGNRKFDVLQDRIDHVIDMQTDFILKRCPLKLDGWQWIDCGTDSETRWGKANQNFKTWTITYTRTWEGCLSADANFYGNPPERWNVGAYADNTMPEGELE